MYELQGFMVQIIQPEGGFSYCGIVYVMMGIDPQNAKIVLLIHNMPKKRKKYII